MGWKEWKYIEPTIHFWTAWLCTLYHLPHYTTSDDLWLICAFSPDITKNVCTWPQLNLFSSKQTVFYPFITCALTLHLYIHLQGSAHVSCHRSVVKVCEKQISRQHFFFFLRCVEKTPAAPFISIAGCTDLGTATWTVVSLQPLRCITSLGRTITFGQWWFHLG